MSVGRSRALAIIQDGSNFDETDKGPDDVQVVTDGIVETVKKDNQIKGKVLQKPSLNNWVRRVSINVA